MAIITSRQGKQLNITMFTRQRLEDGIRKVKSKLYALQINEDTLSHTIKIFLIATYLLMKNKKYATVGSLRVTKKMICNAKLNTCGQSSLNILLSKMLLAELIGKEKVLKPFWNSRCQENSKNLWLPIETDSVALGSNLFSGSLKPMVVNSWFSMKQYKPKKKNSLTTFCQSSTSSIVGKWECEDTKQKKKKRKTEIMGVRKYRLLPTNRQKVILTKWMNTSRYTYNQTIHKINNEKQKINFYNLRNKITPEKKILPTKKWILDTPKDIRANAVQEAVTAYKSAFSNLKNKNIKYFKVRYRSKKHNLCNQITIQKSAIKLLSTSKKGLKVYSSYLNGSLRIKNDTIDKINHDIKIVHYKDCNQWYICVPRKSKLTTVLENQGSVASIDPGDKTLLTIYDKNGNVIKVGTNDMKNKLVPIYKRIDKLVSLRSRSIKRKKYNLKRRIGKLRNKIKNYILEAHTKVCRFLCLEYETILISNLGSVKRNGRTNRRNALTWSHGKMIERLQY